MLSAIVEIPEVGTIEEAGSSKGSERATHSQQSLNLDSMQREVDGLMYRENTVDHTAVMEQISFNNVHVDPEIVVVDR